MSDWLVQFDTNSVNSENCYYDSIDYYMVSIYDMWWIKGSLRACVRGTKGVMSDDVMSERFNLSLQLNVELSDKLLYCQLSKRW